MVNLRPDSPFRPVDWRWERALLLRRSNRLPHRQHDDTYIAQALRFVTERERVVDDWTLAGFAARWPHLYDAHQLRHFPEQSRRSELEAWLLTATPVADIAARIGLSVDMVRWYEALFFHVTDRLLDQSWVAHHVLGDALHSGGLGETNYSLLWKFMAYKGGPFVLEAFTGLLSNPTRPTSPDGLRPFYTAQGRAAFDKKGFIAALTLRCNDPFSKLQLGELWARFQEIERAAQSGSASDEAMKDHIAGGLRALAWGVGTAGRAAGHVPALGTAAAHDRMAAEPRAAEQLSLRAGDPTPALAAVADLKFPPKEQRS